MIDACLQAEREVLEGKTITFNGRTVTMENLKDIREARQEWERKYRSVGRRAGYKRARFF